MGLDLLNLRSRFLNLQDSLRNDRDFTLFLFVGVLAGVGAGINNSMFANFLSDVYHLSPEARGCVELPRELPGMLILFVLALLSFLGDARLASLAMLITSIGMAGLGLFSPTFELMIVFLMFVSLGTHILMPLSPTIGMELSRPEEYGMRLGRFNAWGLIATIIGYAIVWAGFRGLGLSYRAAFVIAAVFYVLASFAALGMKRRPPRHKRVVLIFRRRYLLYYALSVVNGARKQIFLTFAPWVLIQVFGLDAAHFAILGAVSAVLSIATRTIVGRAIDSLGERLVLSAEAVILLLLCVVYAFAGDVLPAAGALIAIACCYVLDNSMSAVEMARSTYVRKIAVLPTDVAHTLSAGTSLDHVVSATIPFLGGLLWAAFGYRAVFAAAAGIAILNLVLSSLMRVPRQGGAEPVAAAE